MSINSDTILRITLTQFTVVLLRCKLCTELRLDLLNDIYTINQYLKIFSEEQLINILLLDFENFILDKNTNILRRTNEFLKAIELFNSLIFKSKLKLFFSIFIP